MLGAGLDSRPAQRDNKDAEGDQLPQQEVFFEQKTGHGRVEVLKTYDRSYAREVFKSIDEEAREALAEALELRENYAPEDIPAPNGSDFDDFLWEELCEAAREDVRNDPSLYSFFVVSESSDAKNEDLYVSPDWPSAEAYARKLIAGASSVSTP